MSKLREKFCNLVDNDEGYDNLNLAEQCEQISDDFAVKFAEWYIDNYHLNKTTNELLQIFKNNFYE